MILFLGPGSVIYKLDDLNRVISTLQALGISYSQIRMGTILVKAFQIVIEIISDMFQHKVNLLEFTYQNK